MLKAQRALLSVYDKRGLVEFARGLTRLGIEILSTGGTHATLDREGVPMIRVSEVTGMPELLDGRVKTLHPSIHGGILADRDRAAHLTELRDHAIAPIDLVVVNLYPFKAAARTEGAAFEQVIEMIDVGGPTMVRAAAKNHRGVIVVVDPDDYPQVLAALEEGEGVVPETLRRQLAIKAFRHTESYDAAIAEWLERRAEEAPTFPRHLLLDLERVMEPRYGENPHQAAALYRTLGGDGVLGGYEQLQGKELSFNNLLDADAARRLVAGFDTALVAIVKHHNPCGVGTGATVAEAYERALATDPDSAFGSVVAVNRAVDLAMAELLADRFVEVVVAPAFDDDALARLAKKKRLRLLAATERRAEPGEIELRALDGGFLAQEVDTDRDDPRAWTCPTERQPTSEERRALELAWAVARQVKSNAIVIANEHQTVGIGAGQMSRVDACRLAVVKARLPLGGTAAASDAFFPFKDGLETLAGAGVRAVIQPGGSKRDAEVIAAADDHDVAMLLTGRRHFRH